MAFNGWLSYCSMKIPVANVSSVVTANVSAMPVLLTKDNFPPQIFTTSAGCKIDGSDIRFSTTSAGTDDLPREIVNIDKTNGILAVYVKIPVISYTSDTTFWCFWNNSNASEPGKGTTSVLTNVWSDFYGVFNFQNTTTAWKGINDSSSQYTNMSVIGTSAVTSAGYASGLKSIVLTTACGMSYNELVSFASSTAVSAYDFSFWINQNGTQSVFNFGTGTNGILYGMLTAGQFGVSWGLLCTTTNAIAATDWHYVHARGVNGTYAIYVDGVDKTSNSGSAAATAFTTFGLGTTAGPAKPVCISDFRMTRNKNTPVNNIKLQYKNYYAPATFVTPGAVTTQSSQVVLTLTGLVSGTEVRIYDSTTTAELTGVESLATSTFSYSYSYTGSTNVNIVIFNLYYQPIRYDNFTLGSSNTTIPIQQSFDRDYYNPA